MAEPVSVRDWLLLFHMSSLTVVVLVVGSDWSFYSGSNHVDKCTICEMDRGQFEAEGNYTRSKTKQKLFL